MRQATRLILNASATFTRMAVNIGIGLYTTRVLLQNLGKIDFGLVMAISAAVSIFTILSITLRTSIGRQMGLATGQPSQLKKQDIFASTQLVLLVCALLILIIGFFLSAPMLSQLTIPAERYDAANIVFCFTLLNLALMVFFTSHEIALISEQEIVINSVFQVLDALFKACAAICLIFVDYDAMVGYIVILTGLNLLMLCARAMACAWKLPYARVSPLRYKSEEVTEMFAFSRWTVMHTAANYLRQDAIVLLINVGFGAFWNALFAVGQQMATYLRNFAMALEAVVLPASLKSEGNDDRHQSIKIAFTGEKYTLLLLSFIAVPLFLNANELIALWLGPETYHESMAVFAKLLIVLAALNITTRCHSLVLFAQGDYGVYSFAQILIAVLSLSAAAILVFAFKQPAELIPWAMISGALVLNVFRVLHVRKRLGIDLTYWVTSVLSPLLWCTVPAIIVVLFVLESDTEFAYLSLLTVIIYALTALPFVWFKGMNLEERRHVEDMFRSLLDKN